MLIVSMLSTAGLIARSNVPCRSVSISFERIGPARFPDFWLLLAFFGQRQTENVAQGSEWIAGWHHSEKLTAKEHFSLRTA
jgi:hypothetical protein